MNLARSENKITISPPAVGVLQEPLATAPAADEMVRLRNLLASGGAVPWKHVIKTVKSMFKMDQKDLGAALKALSPHFSRTKASFSQGLSLLKNGRKSSLELQREVKYALIALLDSRRQARLKQRPAEAAAP